MEQERFEAEVSDLIQAIGLLVRRVRAAGASHELSLTEASVMGRLARSGPATTADLARAEQLAFFNSLRGWLAAELVAA